MKQKTFSLDENHWGLFSLSVNELSKGYYLSVINERLHSGVKSTFKLMYKTMSWVTLPKCNGVIKLWTGISNTVERLEEKKSQYFRSYTAKF